MYRLINAKILFDIIGATSKNG